MPAVSGKPFKKLVSLLGTTVAIAKPSKTYMKVNSLVQRKHNVEVKTNHFFYNNMKARKGENRVTSNNVKCCK